MQRVIVNAVAAGEVECVVIFTTGAAHRLNGFGGRRCGERPNPSAHTWAAGLARERSEALYKDRYVARPEERTAADPERRREENCGERISAGS
jgi:hypothetical protein